MIKYITGLLVIFCLLPGIADAKQQEYRFVTLGNCYTCTLRIEEATQNIDGLEPAVYDSQTDITTVRFDDGKISIYQIMQIVANCGHDTEWYKAPDAAYNQLIGSCCEYERTIDYSQAKVGYLSLMDFWLSVSDAGNALIRVFPGIIADGLLNVFLEGITIDKPSYKLYDIGGSIVQEGSLNQAGTTPLDLSSVPAGSYIVVLEKDNKQLHKSLVRKI